MRHCRKQKSRKTKDYQGFYLLHNLSGHIGQAELSYIIRDHDQTLFQKRKEKMVQIIEKLNEYYGERITYQLYDQYYNMGDRIKENPQCYHCSSSNERLRITPIEAPFRGGTDGSKITYKGIPTLIYLPAARISTVNMNLSLLKRWQRRGT